MLARPVSRLGFWQKNSDCLVLPPILDFVRLSQLTLSLPFSKIECTPDHHSLIKSALFFQPLVFFKFSFWVLNVGIAVFHLRHKILVQFLLRIPSPALLCRRDFEQFKTKVPRTFWWPFYFCLAKLKWGHAILYRPRLWGP